MYVCRYLKCGGLDSGKPCSKAQSVLDEIEEKQEDDEVSHFFY